MHAQCLIYNLTPLIFEILEFNLLLLVFLCYSESSVLLAILFVLTAPSQRQGVFSDWKSQIQQHSQNILKSPVRPEMIFQGFVGGKIYRKPLSAALYCNHTKLWSGCNPIRHFHYSHMTSPPQVRDGYTVENYLVNAAKLSQRKGNSYFQLRINHPWTATRITSKDTKCFGNILSFWIWCLHHFTKLVQGHVHPLCYITCSSNSLRKCLETRNPRTKDTS